MDKTIIFIIVVVVMAKLMHRAVMRRPRAQHIEMFANERGGQVDNLLARCRGGTSCTVSDPGDPARQKARGEYPRPQRIRMYDHLKLDVMKGMYQAWWNST